MGLKDAIIQGGVVFVVFAGIGYVILAKINKTNPKAMRWIKEKLAPGSLYEKPPENQIVDKLEQVYDDKRTMM